MGGWMDRGMGGGWVSDWVDGREESHVGIRRRRSHAGLSGQGRRLTSWVPCGRGLRRSWKLLQALLFPQGLPQAAQQDVSGSSATGPSGSPRRPPILSRGPVRASTLMDPGTGGCKWPVESPGVGAAPGGAARLRDPPAPCGPEQNPGSHGHGAGVGVARPRSPGWEAGAPRGAGLVQPMPARVSQAAARLANGRARHFACRR